MYFIDFTFEPNTKGLVLTMMIFHSCLSCTNYRDIIRTISQQ